MMKCSHPFRKSYTFSLGNQWSTCEFGPGKNGETGKFLWSLSLLIRLESYLDSCINTCFSELKRFRTMKKLSWGTNVEKVLPVK